ncbi:phosphodiester glycosidase family protein [Rufibacter sediminis]|uniref:Phosphodiester glycosidase family protein n=1 Tax=Rufibacter sediminis TaxID=2762756 RepID=A0ABR6VPR4_9BACT|nr:phosphodiester glycosidase family protein [Rufibacter sediminis]MBC3539192.1 phosphodiester glycosidase family protein [Rufibacter sediminis]
MLLPIKRYIIALCAVSSLFAFSGCEDDDEAPAVDFSPTTPVAKMLVDNTSLISRVFSDTTFQVHPGVEETDIHYLSMEGYTMHAFVLKVDLKQPGLSLYPATPFGGTGFAMQTIPDMLKYIDKPGQRVMAAVNSDFFNTSTGEPRSLVYLNGKAVKTAIQAGGRGYFGVDKQGNPFIGDANDYEQRKDNIQHALGGYHRLIRDNQRVSQTDVSIEPRTAVGITQDKVVYFVVVDGRRFDYSNGITLEKLATFLSALGAREALNLDGGGSSTFMIKHPLADVWHMRNWSSDRLPRAVANGWAVVANVP